MYSIHTPILSSALHVGPCSGVTLLLCYIVRVIILRKLLTGFLATLKHRVLHLLILQLAMQRLMMRTYQMEVAVSFAHPSA
jgi:hypothetical protein